MKVSRRVLARFVAQQLVAGNKDITKQLAAYVVEHKLHKQVEMIIADIAANLSELGHIDATVTAAHPLDAQLRADIAAYIKRVENASSVSLDEVVDRSLIGGVIIQTPNQRFDSSLATKLKRLRNA